jgi:hypothetical protein
MSLGNKWNATIGKEITMKSSLLLKLRRIVRDKLELGQLVKRLCQQMKFSQQRN